MCARRQQRMRVVGAGRCVCMSCRRFVYIARVCACSFGESGHLLFCSAPSGRTQATRRVASSTAAQTLKQSSATLNERVSARKHRILREPSEKVVKICAQNCTLTHSGLAGWIMLASVVDRFLCFYSQQPTHTA